MALKASATVNPSASIRACESVSASAILSAIVSANASARESDIEVRVEGYVCSAS